MDWASDAAGPADGKDGYRLIGSDGTVVVVEALTSALQPISSGFLWQVEQLVIADELRAGTSLRGLATLLGRRVVARLTPYRGPSPVVRALPIFFPSRRLRLPHQSSA